MSNILFVQENASYLMASLQERLEAAGHQVVMAAPEMDELSQRREPLSAILIYAEEEMPKKDQPLIYLKDKAVEEDVPIFLIGNLQELDAIRSIIPRHVIQQEFKRPINVNELVETLDNFLKNFAKENKKKILVVDDSGAMLRSVKEWLSESYQVILANSGAMAIKYLAINRPDLVLLDYEMPVVDGKQVLEMIRSEHEFTDIPVIFLTSKDDRESVMNVMSLKPEGYLLKTMKPEQIVKAVDDFFERRKGQQK